MEKIKKRYIEVKVETSTLSKFKDFIVKGTSFDLGGSSFFYIEEKDMEAFQALKKTRIKKKVLRGK